jgi:hypothetical protein
VETHKRVFQKLSGADGKKQQGIVRKQAAGLLQSEQSKHGEKALINQRRWINQWKQE